VSGAGELGLLDFVLARIAETKALAQEADRVYVHPSAHDPAFGARDDDGIASDYWDKVADPARVLAECEAKERIVAAHGLWMHASGDWTCDAGETWTPSSFIDGEPDRSGGCLTLRLLALPYAEHPDFRAEWRT
jgi:hypothetical protein